MRKSAIRTDRAPEAIGAYSQAISCGDTVYLSGQIALDPKTMKLVGEDPREQVEQVFENLAQVAAAAGGSLDHVVRLTVYLTDLSNFSIVNEVMDQRFTKPYPARAAIGVAALPKNALVEIDAVLVMA